MTHCLVNHHINGHLEFVLVSTEWVMMCPMMDSPTSCKIHSVIHFLHAQNMSAAEIHSELCVVYSQILMSEGTVRQWCRRFKDVQTNVHDEDWSGRPVICSKWWSCSKCWPKICERWHFTILELLCEFPQISCTVLYEIITLRLGYHKFYARWFWKCSWACTKYREWLWLWLF
jgi:hypothetical protein